MHHACLALQVRLTVLAWKAQKKLVLAPVLQSISSNRHLPGIDSMWNKCIFCYLKCYIIFLQISKVIAERLFGARGLSVCMRKNWPLCPSQQCLRMLSLSSLDRVDPASWASQSGEMLAGLEGWAFYYRLTGGSTSGSPQLRPLLVVRRISEPTFCFSCKRFTKFCREMQERLARPGWLG